MFVTRRERQRMALRISAEEMAGELEITIAELVVVESRADAAPKQDIGRAWDEALGRILRARNDAAQDAAIALAGDTLRRWGEQRTGPESAHTAATAGAVPPEIAEPARVPMPSSQPKKGQKRRT